MMQWLQDLRCTLFHRWGTGYKLMFRARLTRVQLDGYLCDRCPQWWEEITVTPRHEREPWPEEPETTGVYAAWMPPPA